MRIWISFARRTRSSSWWSQAPRWCPSRRQPAATPAQTGTGVVLYHPRGRALLVGQRFPATRRATTSCGSSVMARPGRRARAVERRWPGLHRRSVRSCSTGGRPAAFAISVEKKGGSTTRRSLAPSSSSERWPRDECDRGRGQTLVQRGRRGESSALEALYRRHSPRLYALLLRMLGQSADAEEVLQESFVDVWKRAAEYATDTRGGGSVADHHRPQPCHRPPPVARGTPAAGPRARAAGPGRGGDSRATGRPCPYAPAPCTGCIARRPTPGAGAGVLGWPVPAGDLRADRRPSGNGEDPGPPGVAAASRSTRWLMASWPRRRMGNRRASPTSGSPTRP